MQFKTISALTIGAAFAVAGVQAYNSEFDFEGDLVTRGFEDFEANDLWARQYGQPQPPTPQSPYMPQTASPQSPSFPVNAQSPTQSRPGTPNSPVSMARLQRAAQSITKNLMAGGPAVPKEFASVTKSIADSTIRGKPTKAVCFLDNKVGIFVWNKGKLVVNRKVKPAKVTIDKSGPAKQAKAVKKAVSKVKKAGPKPAVCVSFEVDPQVVNAARKVAPVVGQLAAGQRPNMAAFQPNQQPQQRFAAPRPY